MKDMTLLVAAFIAAMLFLLAAAECDHDPDAEFEEEAESRIYIDRLADRSKRRGRRSRSRYSASGRRAGR